MDRQIRLLIPYFGTWPAYLPFYLASLRTNPLLDVVVLTDLPLPRGVPDNCSKVHMTMEDLQRRAQERVDSAVCLNHPYKLCDLRPAYGEIFSELLDGFSHWAFGDLDLIYGDLKSMLPNRWRDYDVLSFRREWISGPFTILRNQPAINSLFRQSAAFFECARDCRYVGFDECFGLHRDLRGKSADAVLSIDQRQSFSWLIRSKRNSLRIFQETLIAESIAPNSHLIVDSTGIRDNQGKPYLHYHFVTEKTSPYFAFPRWSEVPDAFVIDRFGFTTHESRRFPFNAIRKATKFALGASKSVMHRGVRFLGRLGRGASEAL